LIFTVVMFQAQNRKKQYLKSLRVLRDKTVGYFTKHNTRPARPTPRPGFWSEAGLVLRPTV